MPPLSQEANAYIALNMVPGLGAVLVRRLVALLGSAEAVRRAGPEQLCQAEGIGKERAAAFAEALSRIDDEAERRRAAETSVTIVTLADERYPRLLREIHDPPLALYVCGDVAALDTACAAMVGTRGPTQYGRETAARFGFQLAQAGVTVVSGLARGIDTESHRAALRAKGRTVAVIGSALDRLYPPENRELARTIATSGGAVVSEYPFGRAADRQTFPMRNRIVSGLSRAVLVVEAGITSGTLITAGHATEQGRSVLAVPGRIDNPAALGCLKLLRQGARLALSVDDVLDEMQTLRGFGAMPAPRPAAFPAAPATLTPGAPVPAAAATAGTPTASSPAPALDAQERAILAALRDAGGEADVELLLARTGLPAHKINAKLIALEMKRCLTQLPGRRVALAKRTQG